MLFERESMRLYEALVVTLGKIIISWYLPFSLTMFHSHIIKFCMVASKLCWFPIEFQIVSEPDGRIAVVIRVEILLRIRQDSKFKVFVNLKWWWVFRKFLLFIDSLPVYSSNCRWFSRIIPSACSRFMILRLTAIDRKKIWLIATDWFVLNLFEYWQMMLIHQSWKLSRTHTSSYFGRLYQPPIHISEHRHISIIILYYYITNRPNQKQR